MPLKSLRRFIAGIVVACLVLLTIHDLAHAKEKHPDQCEVCLLMAQTTTHAPKAAPVIVSHFFRIALAVSPETKPASRRFARAASRDPPAA